MIHSGSGVCVYRRGEIPYLVAYRLLCTQYFVLIYSQNLVSTHTASFSDILDLIPISAHCRPLYLPVKDTIDDTINAWKYTLLNYLLSG